MKTGKKINLFVNITGLAIIFVIVLSGVFWSLDINGSFFSILKALFSIALFLFWGFIVQRRVVSRLLRRYLLMIAGLEILWVLLRLIKFQVVRSVEATRVFWYLYYLPMTLIPALCLLLAISMGKPDSFKPKGFLAIFPVFSLILFVVVMTNDLHGLVFDIPPGYEGLEVGNYGYGAVYYIFAVYAGLCALASFGIIFTKCRVPGSRKIRLLPLIPLAAGAVCCAMYVKGVEIFFGFYKLDITIFTCLLITITLEMCTRCRLIPTNNGYDELFRASSIRCVITDERFTPIIASNSYEEISSLSAAEKSPVILENGFRLSCAPIRKKRVLWQDDLSELNDVLSELSAANDYLEGENAAVRQMYEYRKKERRLYEKNRLYNRILSQTKPEIELYAKLVEQLADETDKEREKALAVRIAFVSGFIKRRDNLVFLSEEERPIDPSELLYCINELLSVLELGNISCSCSSTLEKPIEFERISALFENFYRLFFGITDRLSAVCVYLNEPDGKAAITARMTLLEGALPPITSADISARREDDEWVVTICS